MLSRDFEWSSSIEKRESEDNKDIEPIDYGYFIIDNDVDTENIENVPTTQSNDNDFDCNRVNRKKTNIEDLEYENKRLMRGRTRRSLKRMCCIGGIGISTKNETF